MILGIGSDLVDIRRIEKLLEQDGARFIGRVFTAEEAARAEAAATPQLRASVLAKRFAAKEACAKALGTGFSDGVYWRDMGVVSLPGGRPALCLTGGAAARLAVLLPPETQACLHLSLTDEYPMAQAMVVIEARTVRPPSL